ncbi:NB-ARC domain-containing disease resistance protein [Zostera marina]|uniref:NB-ARC domain-containing disease resistance protein n=1 Tax=Zostera marina TaxID=29655 RepID=A0A0K9NL64_ZOSMR|nr:NB-ARC domain-containing disease resistance protein [Zostera marina]
MESVVLPFALKEASKHLMKTLGVEITLIKNAPDELENLKSVKTVIVNVQQDVVGQELSQQHAGWLDKMMDAACDIEDIIDLSSTEILRRRSNNNKKSTRYTRPVIDFFSYTNNPLIFRHKIGTSVQKTFDRLTNIAKEKGYHFTLSRRDGVGNLRTTMPETFSDMGGDVVLGRDHDLKIILEQLLFKEKTNIEVLVLVGMGGVGKTTLAKLVYNDRQIDALFGERKLWVCVSEIFDLSKIIKLVIEQIDGKPCQLEGLQALSKKLKEILEKNMYLLVLDDVWTSTSLTCDSWSNMKSLFHNCKILVTTREENVTSVILPKPYMHRVGCLPEDACLSLFENIAFTNGDVIREELKDINKSIVKKCKGVPLAVRVLGIEEKNILDPNIEGENRISKILKFSYYHLPLKSMFCFVYCSIFPKDSVMEKMALIQQWVGNGFISLNEGNEIFDDLLSRCFFQDVEKDVYGNIITFKMHDLIHDLAKSIANSRQCGIFDEVLSDRKQVRYLSILNMGEEFSYSDISSKLRTLQLLSSRLVSTTFLDNCFTKFKFLRVLVCSDQFYNLEDVSSSIDNLKLLRYVDFSRTGITRLPETVCNLQNLQTLKVNNCHSLIILPNKLGKLSELRYLENNDCCRLDSMPVGMDRLSLLQTLNTFVVNDGGKNLNELRHLDHLEGSLHIKRLGRISNVVLENGILNGKNNLVSLKLDFDIDDIFTLEKSTGRYAEKVLQALQPHPNLKSLNIIGFNGFFISLDMSCLQSLIHLEIMKCYNLTSLPNDMCSFQSLTHLEIYYCPNFTTLSNNMCCLQFLTHLQINDCTNLTFLPNDIGCLRFLTHLQINDCTNLTFLPNDIGCLRFLTHLKNSRCENLTYLPNSMGYLQSLTHLEISRCENLTYLPNSMGCLRSLTHLEIDNCPNLITLPNDMCCLQSLTHLQINDCPNLTTLPNDMCSLQSLTHLQINDCRNLTTLLNNMCFFQSLTHLQINNCTNLTSLPNDMGCLQSLKHLKISRCENLLSLPNSMSRLKSLTDLTIQCCSSLVDVSFSLEYLTSLKEIVVDDCNHWIRNWSDDAISRICSVEKRSWISICSMNDDIDLLSKWLRKKIDSTKILNRLQINGSHGKRYFHHEKHQLSICCFKQEKLPEELVHVQDLRIMYIKNCPNMSCLPDGMKNLQFLKIKRCPMLEKYCKKIGYKYNDYIEFFI